MESNQITSNIEMTKKKVKARCLANGVDPDNVMIVAVSKGYGPEYAEIALNAGLQNLGENRIQEAASKIPQVRIPARWHLVGHLQKNKAKKALTLFHVIQSVDSVELARILSEISDRNGVTTEIFLQINSSGEKAKSGFAPDEIIGQAETISQLKALNITGLMTIGPLSEDIDLIRKSFELTQKAFEKLKIAIGGNFRCLSMGMSGDYETALDYGANVLRIGTAIFGSRN